MQQTIQLWHGDCLDRLKNLKNCSAISGCTDPPYEIGYMDKGWDSTGITFSKKLWSEIFRILKPGGKVKIFGHSRAFYRLISVLLEVGFENISLEAWGYGQAMACNLNLAKEMDRHAGVEINKDPSKWRPVTEHAKIWEGYGTGIRPSWEPFIVAVKPKDIAVKPKDMQIKQ